MTPLGDTVGLVDHHLHAWVSSTVRLPPTCTLASIKSLTIASGMCGCSASSRCGLLSRSGLISSSLMRPSCVCRRIAGMRGSMEVKMASASIPLISKHADYNHRVWGLPCPPA